MVSRRLICGGIASSLVTLLLDQKESHAFSNGQWRGVAEGQVYRNGFRLPILISFIKPLAYEKNPFGLSMSIGNEGTIGSVSIRSALSFSNGATLQYFTINSSRSGFRGVLTNNHTAEAAAFNGFWGPNVACATAPPVMQSIYCSMGSVENFIFHNQTIINVNYANNKLQGTIQGQGSSLTNIFPGSSNIPYQASFIASR